MTQEQSLAPWHWEDGERAEDLDILFYKEIEVLNFGSNVEYYPTEGKPSEPLYKTRIVACLNACEGISTEALEQGVVQELLEALIDLRGDMPDFTPAGQCRHCGRQYGDDVPERCIEDCPGEISRAAIEKATGEQK